jgi:hypothetical protein
METIYSTRIVLVCTCMQCPSIMSSNLAFLSNPAEDVASRTALGIRVSISLLFFHS